MRCVSRITSKASSDVMTTGAIRVLTLADDSYAMPLAVCIRSLIENHSSRRPLRITIIDGGISEASKMRLAASWQHATVDVSWEFVVPNFREADKALPVWGRVPKLTYARLALPDYLPETSGRIVILDSDTLVLADLSPLHDVELDDAVVGATRDPFIPVVSSIDGLATWREAGLASDTPYFNAGVMVIDVASWVQQHVTERTLDYIRDTYGRLRQYDQDSLNAVLGGQWKELDARWQAHPRTHNSLGRVAHAEPWVVHFSGRLKPWAYHADGPSDRRFYEYLDRTAWKGVRPPHTLASAALRLYDSPLRRLVYPLETRLLALKRLIDKKR